MSTSYGSSVPNSSSSSSSSSSGGKKKKKSKKGKKGKGYEGLAPLREIAIKQQLELLEMFTGFESSNRYLMVSASNGEPYFYANEESGCCQRQCCSNQRGFNMLIADKDGKQVVRLDRPFMCCSGCPCQMTYIDVFGENEEAVGRVQQIWTCCEPLFHCQDTSGNVIATITGQCCKIKCCTDWVYPVRNTSGEEVATISKKFNLAKDLFTDADTFFLEFLADDMPTDHKWIIVAAAFLIDFVFFEDNGGNSN